MNFHRKRPKKVLGNGCRMCQGEKKLGNSNKWWGSGLHYPYTAKQRKDHDRLEKEEGWR